MVPDRTNYEIWLIDYLEGTLDPLQAEQLMYFLNKNPDLKEEFNEITNYSIKPGNDSFSRKNNLLKSVSDIGESQFEYLCIAASENDISDAQAAELEEIMDEKPEKRNTFELIQKLKLAAPEVPYREKHKLRKLTAAGRIIRLSAIGLSAAAAISALVILFNSRENNTTVNNPALLAGNSKKSDSVVSNPVKIFANKVVSKVKEKGIVALNIISPLQKTISDEMKSFNSGSSGIDSSAGNAVIRPVIISKIDFRQNVNLGERSLSGTLVAINIHEINNSASEENGGFNEFIARTFRKKILKSNNPEQGHLKAYEIADAGINGLNKLLGWQMSLQKTKDTKGEVRSVYFSSRLLKFNAPVKKVEPLP